MIQIKVFKGHEIKPYIQTLAEFRVKEFYNFPYLYVGSVEEDAEYSQGYAEDNNALLIVAFNGDDVIGLFSGAPFNTNMPFLQEWIKQALQQGIDLRNDYYGGEIIVKEEYRKGTTAIRLMNHFLKEVVRMGYKAIAGVTSIRPADHPLRPHDYRDMYFVGPRYGFHKTEVTFSVDYPTRQADGSMKEETNLMALWVKTI